MRNSPDCLHIEAKTNGKYEASSLFQDQIVVPRESRRENMREKCISFEKVRVALRARLPLCADRPMFW